MSAAAPRGGGRAGSHRPPAKAIKQWLQACNHRDYVGMNEFFSGYSAFVDISIDNKPPALVQSCKDGRIAVVKYLVKRRALVDIQVTIKSGATETYTSPLHTACVMSRSTI